MGTNNTSNSNNGAPAQGLVFLLTPDLAAYKYTRFGDTQRYFGSKLGELQTRIVTYSPENERIQKGMHECHEIMKAESVHDRVYDETVIHSAAYDQAAARLKSLQIDKEFLEQPVALPRVDRLNDIHKFAVTADIVINDYKFLNHQLENWDDLNPQTQQYLFSREERGRAVGIAPNHERKFYRDLAEVDAELAKLGGVEGIMQGREAAKRAEGFERYLPQRINHQNPIDRFAAYVDEQRPRTVIDEKFLREVTENGLMYFPREYKPLIINSQEFKGHLPGLIQSNKYEIESLTYKARYNIDLARGVYPEIKVTEGDRSANQAFFELDMAQGAALTGISLASGEIAMHGALKVGGAVLVKTGAGELVSTLSSKVPGFVRTTGTVLGVLGVGFATQLPIDNALHAMIMTDENGIALDTNFVEPLTKAEEKEMNKKVMFSDDIPFFSPAARAMTFMEDAYLATPEYNLPGTEIPSRCVGHENMLAGVNYKKGGSPEAKEVADRIDIATQMQKEYEAKADKYFEIRDTVRKLEKKEEQKEKQKEKTEAVAQPIAATEIQRPDSEKDANGIVKTGKPVNEVGGR